MIISFVAYSASTDAPTAGLAGGFSFAYFKRRNLDGSIVGLTTPIAVADDGGGAYSFEVDDGDVTPGSIISYAIALGVGSASAFEVGHIPADAASVNVVPMFLFSVVTGAPVAGISASFALYQRRNADGSVVNLSGMPPTILGGGDGFYFFVVDPSTRPAGAAIEYVVDATAASTSRYLDGVVEDGGQRGVFPPPSPVAPPAQVVPAIAFSADAYADQLAQLLPPGRAFNLEADSVTTGALGGMSVEFARIDARGVDLLNESDPRTANETIADWEKMLSIPDDEILAVASTLAERQIDVTAKYVTRGGQNRQFFIDLCAACGYTLEDVPLSTPGDDVDVEENTSTGGSLLHGHTYRYLITAYNATGETVPAPLSGDGTVTVSGSTDTNTIAIDWDDITGATGYRVYRSVDGGAYQRIATLGTVSNYVDLGAAASGVPPTSSAALLYPAVQRFAKSILRARFRTRDRVYGVAYAYSMLLNLQTPSGAAMAQADFERVVRNRVHAHIVAVIFVFH